MNLFGFTPDFFTYSKEYFKVWFEANKDNIKSEFYIPTMVNKLIGDGTATLRVLRSAAQWHGVTYKEDKPALMAAIEKMMPRVNIPGISGRSFRFSRASFALPCPARTGNTSVCPVRAELRYDEICSAIIKNRFRFRCDTFRIFPERCERGRTRVLPIRPVLHDARNLPAPIVSVIIGLPLPVFATACILLPVACPPLQLARRSSLPAAPACPPLCPPFCLLCLLCLLCPALPL